MLAIFDVVIVVFVLGAAVVFEVGDFVDSVVGSAAIDKFAVDLSTVESDAFCTDAVLMFSAVIGIVIIADIAVEFCFLNALEAVLILSDMFLITTFL